MKQVQARPKTALVSATSAVEAQYRRGDLRARITDALRAAGKDPDRLSINDLGQIDEFHLRGRVRNNSLERVGGKVRHTHAEHVVRVAEHAAAILDLHRHVDEHLEAAIARGRIDGGAVADDHPRFFEIAHAGRQGEGLRPTRCANSLFGSRPSSCSWDRIAST